MKLIGDVLQLLRKQVVKTTKWQAKSSKADIWILILRRSSLQFCSGCSAYSRTKVLVFVHKNLLRLRNETLFCRLYERPQRRCPTIFNQFRKRPCG